MKTLLFPLLAAVALFTVQAQAATFTWDGGGSDESFETAQNWTSDTAPGTGSNDYLFSGSINLNPTITAASTYNFGSITFDSTAGAFTIKQSTASLANRRFGAQNPSSIIQDSAANQRISAPILIQGAGTITFTVSGTGTGALTLDSLRFNQAGAQALVINHDVSIGELTRTDAATGTTSFNVASGKTATVTGNISGTAVGATATFTLQKTGEGTLVLSKAGFNTGATQVQAGTLLISNPTGSATGTGAIEIQNGASLAGTGIIALGGSNVVTIREGGAISAGTDQALGSLTFDFLNTTGGITAEEGSSFAFSLGTGDSSDSIRLLNYTGGDFSLGGPVGLALSDAQVGTFELFKFYSDGGSNFYAGSFDISNFNVTGLSGYSYDLEYANGVVTLSVVPEPSVLSFLGLGGLAIVAFRRRWHLG